MKAIIKSTGRLIATVLTVPLLLLHVIAKLFSQEGLFTGCSQVLSLVPGKVGSYCRVAFYRLALTHCDVDCFIGFNTLFFQEDTEIGKGVYIGPQCNVGKCIIGDDSLVASGVHIMSSSRQHYFHDLKTPIREQGGKYTKIKIGEDCWIGNGALVMANVGNKCVIGAGSVVTADIPDFSIAVGNPAKVIGSRLEDSFA